MAQRGRAGGSDVKPTADAAGRRLVRAISDFLSAHHLHPGPANYALAYQYVTDPGCPASDAIAAATAGGVRLSQEEANRIWQEHGELVIAATQASDAETISDARRQVEEFSSIVEATQVETASYGRDLERGAAELDALSPVPPVVSDIVRITGVMRERTRSAETQLEAARAEAETLRVRLAEAEKEARSDPLTRLPNRRAFEDHLAAMTERGGLLSLAICDIDRFKAVNDTHGHGVGDRVLRMVADVLRAKCEGHMVARIGGEEFVILFDGLDPAAGGLILEEARAELSGRQFKVRGTDAPLGLVTFSAGIASCDAEQAEPPLKRADALLYQAKNGGRNMVVVEPR